MQYNFAVSSVYERDKPPQQDFARRHMMKETLANKCPKQNHRLNIARKLEINHKDNNKNKIRDYNGHNLLKKNTMT